MKRWSSRRRNVSEGEGLTTLGLVAFVNTFLLVVVVMFSFTYIPPCKTALIWLENEPLGFSLLGVFGVTFSVMAAVSVLRCRQAFAERRRVEWLAQATLISGGLVIVLKLLVLFVPHAWPARVGLDNFTVFGPRYSVFQEEVTYPPQTPAWPYDVPPPPYVPPSPQKVIAYGLQAPVYGDINPSFAEVFGTAKRPTPDGLKRLRRCSANIDAADRIYAEAVLAFNDWYVANADDLPSEAKPEAWRYARQHPSAE